MTDLYTELTTGPLKDEIAPYIETGNDGAIYEILHRKDINVLGIISSHDICQYFMLTDVLLPIEASTSPACKVANRALELFPEFDLAIPYVAAKFAAILDALIAENMITQEHKQTILVIATKKISRALQLGMEISITEIAQALRG